MAYGEIKVDTITFTDGGIDKSVSISGLVQNPTFSGNITVTGTISGNIVRGQTVSGNTVTGTTAQFTSGTFTNITGGVATITSGVFASGSAAAPSVSVGTTDNGIYSPGTDQVAISTNGTGRLFVDSSGNVGVGTSSPGTKLEIVGGQNSVRSLRDTGTGGLSAADFGGGIAFGTSSAGSAAYLGANIQLIADQTWTAGTSHPSSLIFSTAPSGSITSSERLRITSDGKVGIGTASPLSVLDVQTNAAERRSIRFSGTGISNAEIHCTESGGYNRSLSIGGQEIGFFTDTGGATTRSERARIDSSGRLGIGTTTPSELITVNGNIFATSGGATRTITLGPAGAGLEYNVDGTTYLGGRTDAYALAFRTNNTERLRITSDGKLGLGTSSPSRNLDIAAGQANVGITSSTTSAGNEPTLVFTHAGNNAYVIKGGNDLQFASDAGANVRMTLTTAGRLGVGTTSPSQPLEVRGPIGATEYHVAVGDANLARILVGYKPSGFAGTANSAGISADNFGSVLIGTKSDVANIISFGTSTGTGAATERARIDSSGRLGVGTTSPSYLLDVAGDSRISGTNGLRIEAGGTGTQLYNNSGGTVLDSFTASTSLRFLTQSTERARIDSSGRLLVGTSSGYTFTTTSSNSGISYQQLVGVGTDETASLAITLCNQGGVSRGPSLVLAKNRSGATTLGIVQVGENLGELSFQGSATSAFVRAASIVCFQDGGTPSSTSMAGRLVFSTTADGASSPTERMRLTSNGYFYHLGPDFAATFQTAAGAGTTYSIITGGHTATSISSVPNACFRVWSNGDVVNTNNSYGAISDIKLKENIVDANSQWHDLRALRIRNYNFKSETNQQTHTQIGLIAQEVELVSPGLVSESPDRDADGNDLGTVTKSVNYSVLYMKAVKALQEAMERIETLEASNTDLLARVSALESA